MANKERVNLLVDALNSGEYMQGFQALESVDLGDSGQHRLCCLGVACRVAMANGLDLGSEPSMSDISRNYRFAGEVGFLPAAVRDWYGFETADPHLWPDEESAQTTAVGMNDAKHYDFPSIAAAFRRTYVDEWSPEDRTRRDANEFFEGYAA